MKCNKASTLKELGFSVRFKRGLKFSFGEIEGQIVEKINDEHEIVESDITEVYGIRLRYANPDNYEGTLYVAKTKKGWFSVDDFYENQYARKIDGRKLASEIRTDFNYSFWLNNMSFNQENIDFIYRSMCESNRLTAITVLYDGSFKISYKWCNKTNRDLIEVRINLLPLRMFSVDESLFKEEFLQVLFEYCKAHFRFSHEIVVLNNK